MNTLHNLVQQKSEQHNPSLPISIPSSIQSHHACTAPIHIGSRKKAQEEKKANRKKKQEEKSPRGNKPNRKLTQEEINLT